MSAPQLASGSVPTALDSTAVAVRRKRLGQWYTPAALVDHLLAVVRDTRAHAPQSILDPSCGDGRFLLAARAVFGPGVRLVGVDIDEHAIAAARHLVPGAELIHADALAMDFAGRTFDLVIGNPPFLNQMASSTSRGGRSRFGGGPYADAAAEFLALAVRLATPAGGQVALVLPQSILTARDAGPIRADATSRAALTHAWWSTATMFDAAVHVCALVFTAGRDEGEVTRSCGTAFEDRPSVRIDDSWGRLLTERPDSVTERSDGVSEPTSDASVLGDLATFSSDFREQYYGLIGAVSDDADGPPLVTCGLIDPGVCRWGERPVRFAKQRFEAPRVDLAGLSPRLIRWAEQRLVPKVLIANQTPRIEAVIDRDGAWLPSVPVITCVPHDPADLDLVAELLSSSAATDWVVERAAGSGLSPAVVRLSPSLLARVPVPNDARRTAAS